MFRTLLGRLACPRCKAPLGLAEGSFSSGGSGGTGSPPGAGRAVGTGSPESVSEGRLTCAPCARTYAITNGIPRLLADEAPPATDAASTRRAFERQWQHYHGLGRIFGKDPAAMARNLVNERMGARIRADWYPGRWVLDAGCGHGRYLSRFAELGATAVGVDVGRGPEAAGVPLDDPRIHVVQGDVLRLPFADASFDLAFCDGVLHHTPDPRRGFAELCRVVKPGGAVYVWLYPKEGAVREAVFGAARFVTTRLPGPVLRTLCFAVAPLTAGVRSYSGTAFPRATWGECAQVVHDWLAPRLQSHHTFAEVAAWAREEGLGDVEELPVPVGAVAWKPLAGAPPGRR